MGMMSTVAPWDLVADGYYETTMTFFQEYTDAALQLIDLQSDDTIVDIACGPGTLALTAAGNVTSVKAVDFSKNMLAVLRREISDGGVKNIEPLHGDGQDLPYENDSFDAAFSMFGLMFFPDRTKGYGEAFRTLKPGGRICITSWAPVADSPLHQVIFGALRAINPDLPKPKTDKDSLENPDLLQSELIDAGFRDVKIHRVTKSIPVTSVAEFWDGMAKGSAPVTMMKNNMTEEIWAEKSEIAINHIANAVGSLPASLAADAWFGIGTK